MEGGGLGLPGLWELQLFLSERMYCFLHEGNRCRKNKPIIRDLMEIEVNDSSMESAFPSLLYYKQF